MARFRRSTRQRLAGSFAALAVVVTAAACGADDSAAGTNKDGVFTVRATVTPGVGSLPFEVAIKKGFFRKHGLEMEVTEGVDFKSYLASLDRQFDVVMLTTPTTMSAAVAGLPMKAFGGMESMAEGATIAPYVTKDPNINSVEDLARKGGTMASVTGLSDTTKAILGYVLRGTGLDLSKIKFVAMPFPDMADQLAAGRIDAAGMAAGYFEPLLEKGYHVFYESPKTAMVEAGAELPLASAHFVSSASFADEHLDVVQSFQDSIEEAEEWISANEAEAREILQEYTGVTAEFAEQATIPRWKSDVEASDFEPWVKIFEFGGLMDEPFDPESLIVRGLR